MGPLSGVRVLDLGQYISGPHATTLLAEMGAEVIKIETEEGETMRTRPPVRNHCSTAFGQLNVGKNSLVLDLKSPEGLWRSQLSISPSFASASADWTPPHP